MRVKLVIDSATTEEVRALAARISRLDGVKYPRMNCEGPTHWGAETEMMHVNEVHDLIHALEDA